MAAHIYFRKTLTDNLIDLACPLDNGRHHGNAKNGLGDMDRLPLELQSSTTWELHMY